jgi:hypothetical protein
MAILAALIVAGLVFNIYSLVTRRKRRLATKAHDQAQERHAATLATVPGLAELAASRGWKGPSTDPGLDQVTAGYVQHMLQNFWTQPQGGGGQVSTGPPWFTNVYMGEASGRSFVVGNAWLGLMGVDRPGSIGVLRLGEALPPLFVNLRRYRPFLRMGLKEMPFESEQFNQRFQVLALNREYAMDVVSERAMELLLERDDWTFFLEFDRMLCVCRTELQTPADFAARVDALTAFADLIPHFVEQDRAAKLPTLPDGTTLDLTDPASREKMKQAYLAMTPEQRVQAVAGFQEEALRFISGAFGKELSPEMVERMRERLGQEMSATEPKAPPSEGGNR